MKNSSIIPGVDISNEHEDLLCYGFDSSIVDSALPWGVAWPKNAGDVSQIVRFAQTQRLKIVPRGAGTGMAGASIPNINESIIVSFERMRRILEINPDNMTAMVEPGTVNSRLQRELERHGLFYPPDPASLTICTIGGNVATNAGGPRAVKYGVTRDYVLELEAVLADGDIVTLGGRTTKRVVGYDLKQLLIGSEGTLAAITKIRLRILPQAEDVVTLLIKFRDLGQAGAAVSKIIATGIIPATMELMDRSAIKAVEQHKPTGLPSDIDALLLVELDGHSLTIQKEAEKIVQTCKGLGGETAVAQDRASRERLWEARRSVSPAIYRLKPNKINEDIVVPRESIADVLLKLQQLSRDSGITIVCYGHAGDGNIHVNVLADRNIPDEYSVGRALVKKIFEITLSAGGSISGEHGIGLAKMPYLGMEIKERELQLMRSVKEIFDPGRIMNPGKIFV